MYNIYMVIPTFRDTRKSLGFSFRKQEELEINKTLVSLKSTVSTILFMQNKLTQSR